MITVVIGAFSSAVSDWVYYQAGLTVVGLNSFVGIIKCWPWRGYFLRASLEIQELVSLNPLEV